MASTLVDAIGLELVVAADSPPGTTELDVIYDGTVPPLALFDALEAAGWTRPVAAPPPRSAIDWSEPDPARGTRYSIRPFRAVSRVHPGPAGSPAQLVRATFVLAQAFGAVTPEPGPEVVHRPAEPVVAPTAIATSAPTPAPDQEMPTPEDRSGPDATLRIVIAAARVDLVLAHLGTSIEVVDRRPTSITKTNTYRGQVCETQVQAVELTMLVDPAALDEVCLTLQREAGASPTIGRDDPA